MVTMQSPPLCVDETDDDEGASPVHHRHRRSARGTALGNLKLSSRGSPLSSPQNQKSVASSPWFVEETRGDVSSGNSSTGVTLPSGRRDGSTRVALAVPSDDFDAISNSAPSGCRCRIALLNGNMGSRSRIAASRDHEALADCAGVITTDNDGWKTLHIPKDFCRSMYGSLEEELSALYGVDYGVDYDVIEGADHLPHAEKGQGGVPLDRATVSAFQKMSDDEQISWLLDNNFFVDPDTPGDRDKSEHNDAAMMDESSGQTAAVCADSSTTSLVVAEDEGNAMSYVPTGDDDYDETIEFGDDGGFLPDGATEDRCFGECAAASSSSPLGGTERIPSLGGGDSAIEFAEIAANSCKVDEGGTMDLVTRDDSSGRAEDLPALGSNGESLICIVERNAPVVTEAHIALLEPVDQSTKNNEQVLSQAGEGDNNIHPSSGQTEGLPTLETGGSTVIDILDTFAGSSGRIDKDGPQPRVSAEVSAAVGSETEGLPRIETAGASPVGIAASVLAGRNDTHPTGHLRLTLRSEQGALDKLNAIVPSMLYCERHVNESSGREIEKKEHHKSLAAIFGRFVRKMHRSFAEMSPHISEAYHGVSVSDNGLVTITCKELDDSTGKLPGAYLALMQTTGGSLEIKSGISSRTRKQRAGEQKKLVKVFDGMSDADWEKIIPEGLVDEVARLRCPRLCFIPQKQHEERLEIRRYLAEILNGCLFQSPVYPFGNGSVGEGLWMSMPTAVHDKLNPALTNEDEAVAFMSDVEKIVITPTWITFLNEIYREAQRDSPDLLKLLPSRPDDPWSCSATHYMYRQLWGDDIVCLPCLPEDAINESPRKAYLDPIVDKIGTLLLEIQCREEYQSDGIIPINLVSELRELLRPLRGEFYDNYMQPTDRELAVAMKALLEKNLVDLPSSHAIVMERCAYRAMKEHEPDFWESIFAGAEYIDILKRGTGEPSEDAALLITTRRGERIIVTKSHFKVFSELTTLEVSAGASESFISLAEIRNKTGKMSDEHFNRIKEILGTFLGRWMGFGGTLGRPSGSFYAARRLALDEGVIAPLPPAGVLTVSKPLELHYLVVLYMWHSLGPDFFALLYQACGFVAPINSDGRPVTPLDPSFVCPVCEGKNTHRTPDSNRIMCALADFQDSAIPPIHCCSACSPDIYHAELLTCAEALHLGVTLTEDQQRRGVRAQKEEQYREQKREQKRKRQQKQQQYQARIEAGRQRRAVRAQEEEQKKEQKRDWKREQQQQQQQYKAQIEAEILERYQPSRITELISRATEITGYMWLLRQVKAHPGQLANLEERTISGYSWVFIHSLTPPKCSFPKVLLGDRIVKINGEDVSGMNMTQIATKLDRVSNTEWKLDILRPFRVAGASNQQPAAKKMKTCDDKAMLLKVFPEAIVAYDNAVQDQSDLGGDSLAKNIISFKDMDKDCIRAILFVSFDKYVPKSWARKKLATELAKNIMDKFDWRSKERGDLWADYCTLT